MGFYRIIIQKVIWVVSEKNILTYLHNDTLTYYLTKRESFIGPSLSESGGSIKFLHNT